MSQVPCNKSPCLSFEDPVERGGQRVHPRRGGRGHAGLEEVAVESGVEDGCSETEEGALIAVGRGKPLVRPLLRTRLSS
jgi:hypothetical protein